jgi:NodT family efflux transporter outer membrane factor (OMF) lipoprotein
MNFNDPVINRLVATALERNLDLVSADASIRASRAQLNIAESANQIQLNGDGRVGRDQFSRNSENFANIPFPNPATTFSDYRVGFDASWEIDLFGHNQKSTEAARARLNSVEYQRQDVELRVAAEVVRNVVDYRAWQQRRINAERIIADNRQLRDLITLQRKAGLLADADVLDAQTALHNAAANLGALQSAEQAALMALTVLVNQPADTVSTTLASVPAVDIGRVRIDTGLPSDLLLRRPDLQSAERELAAASADIGVAMANQYPRIDLLADGGLDSITTGKLTQLASRYWSIGPQLTVPLLSGGRLAAQVKSTEAARDAALAHYRQAVLSAFADTETALIRFQREQQRGEHIQLAWQSQQQQVKFAELRHQTGDTNFTPVLQARLQLAQINDAQLASQQATAENLTALYKALGGGTVASP